jgi:DsbC/DsbD-like thiol-disulfide interchange protein
MRYCLALAAALAVGVTTAAQSRRPQLTLTPTVETSPVHAGSAVHLSLKVEMPANIHVQANQPRDPSLIPTVLDVQPPAGVTVDSITYPEPKEFKLAGSKDSLLVYGPEFTVQVQLKAAPKVSAGNMTIAGILHYQACDERICFAPTRATTEWAVQVAAGH